MERFGGAVTIKSNRAGLAQRAFEFAAQAATFRTMKQVAAAVERAIAPVGMTAVACGFVSGPKAASGNPFHFNNWPQTWALLYTAEDFMLADPIVRWARNSGQAISWANLIRALPERDRGRKVVKAAARFGYTEGMVVPMRARDNSLGLVGMGGGRGALLPYEQTYLVQVGRTAFEAADRIANRGMAGRAAPILSLREIECLALLVRGHSDIQIGKLLGMTIRTVRFHLANARRKFSAGSRTHLAALAVAQGYIVL